MTDETKKLPASFQAMETDLQVNMDDVVSAFVARYENNLFTRKKELRDLVKGIETQLAAIDKQVTAEVTGDEFENEDIKPFGLFSEISGSMLEWGTDDDKPEKNRVRFEIVIKCEKTNPRATYYGSGNKITISRYKPIPKNFVVERDKLSVQVAEARAELHEVLESIKSVSRKERQVRGEIAIRKLEDAGYESLMQDPALAQLVELD